MVERVPLTLFTRVDTINSHATWNDPYQPSNPWNGYTYQWILDIEVRSQTHSDPTTVRPYTYNGLDISIGDWLIFTASGMALEVISIVSQSDNLLTIIVEDVNLHNLLNDPGQSGQGIGGVSGNNTFDCLVINLNSSGVPIFASLPDYSVPINMVSDIANRFQFRNYVQDFIPGFQFGNGFTIGDVIYIDPSSVYHKSIASEIGSKNSIGTVTSIDQPNIGSFTYRPLGRYVKNLPTLPGAPGDLLYVSSSTPGGLTSTAPSPYAIPVYIKVSNTAAILTSGSGSTGGSVNTGNIGFAGNTILATNPNGNIVLQPSGNGIVHTPTANIGNLFSSVGSFTSLTPGRVVIVGPNGQLVDSGYFIFDISSKSLSAGNITLANDYITTAQSGIPLILTANNANVHISATLDLQNNRITNVLNPEEDQDAATKSYVDAVASGLSIKEPVFVATTIELDATFNAGVAFGSLTGNIYERLVIDIEEPALNSRILVKNQTNEIHNGIYSVLQIGSPSEPWILIRTDDFNGQGIAGDIRAGDFVFVENGDINADTGWVMTSPNPVSVNVSDIHWAQFSAAGVIQPGFGLTKDGTVLNVNVAALIDTTTGLSTNPGPGGNNIIEIYLASNTPLEFNSGALRVKDSIAGVGLGYNLTFGNLNILSSQPTITGLGNIITGTWSANTIEYQYGGTGLNALGLAGQSLVVNPSATALAYEYRSKLTENNIAPISAADGDKWFNTDTGMMFTRITDINGSHWIEV